MFYIIDIAKLRGNISITPITTTEYITFSKPCNHY